MRAAFRLYRQLHTPVRLIRSSATNAAGAGGLRSRLARSVWRMGNDEWRTTAANRPAVVFYHYPCPDGVFAALAASMFFQQQAVHTRFYPLEVYRQPDMQAMQLRADETAYLLDYAGPEGFPQQLAQHVQGVYVLDHHKTAAAQLADTSSHPPNLHVHIDMQRSGAMLARDWFNPAGVSSQLQQVFEWVQDADLWSWKLPDSRAFHAGLAAQNLEYSALKNPQIWQQLQQLDAQKVIQDGKAILDRQEQLTSAAVARSKLYQLGGAQGLACGWGTCLGVTVQGELTKFRSHLGNQLAQRSKQLGLKPVGLIAYIEADMPQADTHIKVSLRSIDGFDTSKICEASGGGGHAAASSCIISQEQLLTWEAMAQETGNGAKQQLGEELAGVIDSHVGQQ